MPTPDLETLLRQRNAALQQVALLREAIEKHRDRVWGAHKVAHDSDVDLYAVLEKLPPLSSQ